MYLVCLNIWMVTLHMFRNRKSFILANIDFWLTNWIGRTLALGPSCISSYKLIRLFVYSFIRSVSHSFIHFPNRYHLFFDLFFHSFPLIRPDSQYLTKAFNSSCIHSFISFPCIYFSGVINFVNCASVKWAERMQIVFTVAKMLAIVLLIITGIVRIAQGTEIK